jgi:sulfonate transport system ATP-binding protein
MLHPGTAPVAETALALNGATKPVPSSGALRSSGAAITFRDVTKRFPTARGGIYTAIRDVNLDIRPGEFCTVVGPTGCGKSTMLGLIAGLNRPSSGTVGIDGHQVTAIGDRIGYMFQNDAIFPWRSVLENVAAGPRYRGRSRKQARSLAREWIARVGLKGFEDRYPHQLSGGMRKRVALAQTLINEPQILLMDEPFSALDVQTRTLMENELLTLWSTTYATVVFVTHDLEEAIALADRVFVITAGPGTVKSSYRIDLPRPRNVSEIRFLPQFLETYQTIWNDLREEVLVSYERAKHAG